jgi:hypothetical protein
MKDVLEREASRSPARSRPGSVGKNVRLKYQHDTLDLEFGHIATYVDAFRKAYPHRCDVSMIPCRFQKRFGYAK